MVKRGGNRYVGQPGLGPAQDLSSGAGGSSSTIDPTSSILSALSGNPTPTGLSTIGTSASSTGAPSAPSVQALTAPVDTGASETATPPAALTPSTPSAPQTLSSISSRAPGTNLRYASLNQ